MITKIKSKGGTVEIHSETMHGKETVESVFKCTEPPHPDLNLIFVKLEKIAREILDIGKDTWHGQITVDSVSFSDSESTGVQGAVITGHVALETSNSPFNFNTPHLPFAQYSPTGTSPLMPSDGIELLDKLSKEAALYQSGKKRAQLELIGK